MRNAAVRTAVALALAMAVATPAVVMAQEDGDRVEKLERELDEVRAQLEALRQQLAAKEDEEKDADDAAVEERLDELARRIDVLAGEIERDDMGGGVYQRPEKGEHGLGLAASKVYQVDQGLSIGGYGEGIFSSYDSDRDDGAASGRSDTADFLRAVLYFGYKFNDRWLFNSEIEVEHASTGTGGEVSLEFANIDYLWKPAANVRAGLLLVPMGFVNELHEPPLFLGVRRPDIESQIIPSTWRENGVGVFGDVGPFTYRSYLLNGLDGSGFSAAGLRGGRQKGSRALAEDIAWVGRIDYTAMPGLLAGISGYIGDSGQNLSDEMGAIGAKTNLFEGHVEWKAAGFELRALGVQGSVDDVMRLNEALGLVGSQSVGEELRGYYVQLGYDVLNRRSSGGERALIPFVRWESFDTQDEVPLGFGKDPARDVEVLTFGLSFKPLDELVFKADYQNYDNDAGTGVDQFNLGIGYLF